MPAVANQGLLNGGIAGNYSGVFNRFGLSNIEDKTPNDKFTSSYSEFIDFSRSNLSPNYENIKNYHHDFTASRPRETVCTGKKSRSDYENIYDSSRLELTEKMLGLRDRYTSSNIVVTSSNISYSRMTLSNPTDQSSASIPSCFLKNHAKIGNAKTPASVARRNARERRRIKSVNQAFDDLRKRVPHGSSGCKISKVETLRSAIEYIRALQLLIDPPTSSNAADVIDQDNKWESVSSTTSDDVITGQNSQSFLNQSSNC